MEIEGIMHKRGVADRGITPRKLARWLDDGMVESIQPWYVRDGAPPALVALLRLGVRPTCVDAASLHGLWTPEHDGTHVFRPRPTRRGTSLAGKTASPVRLRNGEIVSGGGRRSLVLHDQALRAWPSDEPVPTLPLVLDHASRCLPSVKAATLFESALHLKLLTPTEAERIIAALPVRFRRSLSRVREGAESGTETTVRWWFESRGVPITAQAPFPSGARRMDLLVGKSWAIECDSRAHHDDPESYARDRERDLYLAAQGYTVTRLTWEQVFVTWKDTEMMLRTILARGEYRRSPAARRGEVTG